MKKHLLIFLLLAALCPWAAQAQTKTHIANASSSTQMTWAEFAQNVNNGITYEGQTVYLDSNVTATTRAGYESGSDIKSFQGTFEGQGHTITFNFTANSGYAAPFACVKNATFLNLKTAGTITANTKRYAGGIAGMVISGSQNCTFTNCESNVTITSTSNGTDDCRHGGFVANVVGGNVTFNGCAFTGGFSGTNAKGWGGFVGYFNHYVYFTDCIFSPTSISIYNQNNSTFARPSGTQVTTFTNCYYTQSLGGSQGKQRYTITAESPATVAMSGTATNHNVSHITAYSDNQGLVYNGTIVAGEGDNVSLNLGGGDFYMASPGTITGNGNPYTLAMEAQNTIISIPKTHIASTSSDTQMTWAEFAQNVNNGTTYEGQTIYLDADVTATTMAGTNETNCFKGTFEGQGHTLTFNYTASGSYYTAPFHYLNGATIQNLKVSGTITANYARCGGLAGDCYGTNAIINCLSNITINSTVNGDGTHGGFISRVYRGTTTFEGCTFAGSLLGENTTANGGFVGWSEGNNNYASVSFSNCIYAPVANTTDPSAGATFARGRNNSTTGITISNCFYTSSEFQYTQGKQAYTITGQSPVSVAMNGTATYHNVSHIKGYSDNPGLVYNGTIVAGEDDIVSLNLGGALSFSADHGTLTGTANPYTLSMEAYNTTISAVTPLELDAITIGQLDSYYYTMETTLAGRYGYNYSVYIYKPEDSDFLNFDFDLASLAFNVTRATSTPIAEMTLWVKDVDADFLTIRYWTFSEYIDGATQVYDSQAAFAATTGWNTFNLTTNFSHEGGKALLVAVRSVGTNLAGSGSTNNWNYCSYTTKTRSHWRKCANNTDPGTAVDGEWDGYDKRADIQLGVTYTSATCFIPSDLTVAYPAGTDTEVTLGWTENGEATAWQICLNDDETNLIDANTNPFTLTGLTPETLYFAKVRANCGDLHSNWSDAAIIQPTLKTVIGMYDAVDVGYLPTNIFANYSMSEQVYTADELGEAGNIMSIDFFNNSTGSATRNLKIYMAHCDVSSPSSDSWGNWINITPDDLVFSGTVDFASKAWTSITLDTPFDYNGTQNVVLKVADNTGTASGQIYFLNNTNPDQIKRARGVYGDQIYDPTDETAYQQAFASTNRNYIRLMKAKKPTGLTASSTTSQDATLSWTENGTATAWQICLNGDMSNLIDVTTNPYTLTGLNQGTTYTAKVRSTCGAGHTNWSNEVYFAALATLPSSDDFENGMDGWIFVNDESLTNAWCWGTAAHNGEGTHGIYISNDGGNNFQYNYSPTYDRLYAYKTFEFEEGDYKIDFDVISGFTWYPSAYYDKLSLWLVPASNDPSQGVEAGGTRLNNTSSVISDWQTMSYEFSILTAGSYRLVFMWECAVGQGYINQYGEDYFYANVHNKPHTPAAIDNVNITQIIGRKPTRLQCTTQGNTATLNWVDYNDTAGWQICLNGDESNLITTFSKPYTITGLTYDTTYTAKVRTIINNDATDWSDEISFTPTHLNPPTNLQCPIATHENTSLRWTENYSDIDHWEICLNGDESNLINATTNPFAMAGLTTDATYTAKVRSVTTYGESTWSEEISFVPAINTVTVLGTGTETIIGLPFANHATDVQTQQIYTADELGAAGDILSIAFYKTGTTPCSRNLTIYMTPTSQDQCTSFLDWVDTSDGQLVFSGTVNFANNGWTTITLSTPFTYNGLQNLALTVFDQTTTAGETANFLCYLTPKKQAMVLESGANATCTNKKNQIRIVKNGIHTDITGYGTGTGNWSLVASPLAGEVNPVYYSNMIWNSFDLYRFNQSAALEWENWKQEGDHYHFNLENGKGYLYANSENVTLVFSGVPYSGNGQVTLSKDDNARLGQWNLIGNPFATEATIGSKPFYVMNDLGTEIIAATEPTIAAMEGIFVKANEDGETVTFTTASTGGAKGGHDLGGDLVLNLSQDCSTPIDRVIIRFGEGEALPKLQIRDGSPKVYIQQDGKDYAIVNAETQTGEIPVSFKAAENDTYTLTVSTTLNSQLSTLNLQYLHLIDNMTGNDVDLLATPTYTFQAKTTDFASRFKLVFAANEEDGLSTGSGTFAFFDGSAWVIGNEGRATLQVIDILGHVLRSETIDGNATLSTSGLGAGMYVMRLVNGEEVRVQKIVVR